MVHSVLSALEYRFSEKELREDASDGPNIDSGRLDVPANEHQNSVINCGRLT